MFNHHNFRRVRSPDFLIRVIRLITCTYTTDTLHSSVFTHWNNEKFNVSVWLWLSVIWLLVVWWLTTYVVLIGGDISEYIICWVTMLQLSTLVSTDINAVQYHTVCKLYSTYIFISYLLNIYWVRRGFTNGKPIIFDLWIFEINI